MTDSVRDASRLVLAPLLALLLAACGERPAAAPGPTAAKPEAQAAPAITLSPELQAIYNRSCMTCHATPSTGAPQAGDRAAWAPRVAQGSELLLDHTINGFNAMPPMGACMDCSPEQYTALIEYMANTRLAH